MEIQHNGIDAIQIRKSGEVVAGKRIVDTADANTKKKAHRDAIQIIPERNDGTWNTQYAGACIADIEIRNNTIESDGYLQCIFCSDGMIKQVWITDNSLQTSGQHFISVCALSGHIKNNRKPDGSLAPIKLLPVRIGGNEDGEFNVYILSFKDDQCQYRSTKEIVRDGTLSHVTDYRTGQHRKPNDIYLRNFDMDAFVAETSKQQLTPSQMRELALQFGVVDEIKTTVNNMWKTKSKSSKLNHMQIAQAEQGISEIPGNNHNERIVGYFQATDYKATNDETAWCSAFVNWVLMQAGIPRTKSAAALSFKSWGVECEPHYGCIVVIPRGDWRGHVGFLVSWDDQYYHILGGNQNDEVNVASFSRQEHQFFFRCQKRKKDSKSMKVDAARIGTGATGVAAAGYELIRPKNPDTGHANTASGDTTPADIATEAAPSALSIPDGYLLFPEWGLYGLIVVCMLLILSSLFTRSERNEKIEEYGI